MAGFAHFEKLRGDAKTARVGVKWTEEEDETLMKTLCDAQVIDDALVASCAAAHHRTPEGIRARIEVIALRLFDAKVAPADISAQTGIPAEKIHALWHAREDARHSARVRKIKAYLAEMSDEQVAQIFKEVAEARSIAH
jgi:hypothetical protein